MLAHRQAASPPSRTPPATTTTLGLFAGPLPGDLLIADRGNNRILLVNPRNGCSGISPSRPGQHHLFFDDDTFFAPGGRAIISNQEENHQIVMISYPGGRLIWSYGHPGVKGSAPGYLNTPDDAYKLRNGMVIVADAYNCRVLEIRGQRIVRSIGQAGHCVHDPPRYLGAVNGDTPLPNGHILVSEINGSYLDEFTLAGKLVRVYRAPVTYPSDPQLTLHGNILLADYTSPGGLVILDRRTGRLRWQYRVSSGPGRLDHPSLAAMLPNGMIAVNDDYNHRVVIIDPRTKRIVWQYGHTRRRRHRARLPEHAGWLRFCPGHLSREGQPGRDQARPVATMPGPGVPAVCAQTCALLLEFHGVGVCDWAGFRLRTRLLA